MADDQSVQDKTGITLSDDQKVDLANAYDLVMRMGFAFGVSGGENGYTPEYGQAVVQERDRILAGADNNAAIQGLKQAGNIEDNKMAVALLAGATSFALANGKNPEEGDNLNIAVQAIVSDPAFMDQILRDADNLDQLDEIVSDMNNPAVVPTAFITELNELSAEQGRQAIVQSALTQTPAYQNLAALADITGYTPSAQFSGLAYSPEMGIELLQHVNKTLADIRVEKNHGQMKRSVAPDDPAAVFAERFAKSNQEVDVAAVEGLLKNAGGLIDAVEAQYKRIEQEAQIAASQQAAAAQGQTQQQAQQPVMKEEPDWTPPAQDRANLANYIGITNELIDKYNDGKAPGEDGYVEKIELVNGWLDQQGFDRVNNFVQVLKESAKLTEDFPDHGYSKGLGAALEKALSPSALGNAGMAGDRDLMEVIAGINVIDSSGDRNIVFDGLDQLAEKGYFKPVIIEYVVDTTLPANPAPTNFASPVTQQAGNEPRQPETQQQQTSGQTQSSGVQGQNTNTTKSKDKLTEAEVQAESFLILLGNQLKDFTGGEAGGLAGMLSDFGIEQNVLKPLSPSDMDGKFGMAEQELSSDLIMLVQKMAGREGASGEINETVALNIKRDILLNPSLGMVRNALGISFYGQGSNGADNTQFALALASFDPEKQKPEDLGASASDEDKAAHAQAMDRYNQLNDAYKKGNFSHLDKYMQSMILLEKNGKYDNEQARKKTAENTMLMMAGGFLQEHMPGLMEWLKDFFQNDKFGKMIAQALNGLLGIDVAQLWGDKSAPATLEEGVSVAGEIFEEKYNEIKEKNPNITDEAELLRLTQESALEQLDSFAFKMGGRLVAGEENRAFLDAAAKDALEKAVATGNFADARAMITNVMGGHAQNFRAGREVDINGQVYKKDAAPGSAEEYMERITAGTNLSQADGYKSSGVDRSRDKSSAEMEQILDQIKTSYSAAGVSVQKTFTVDDREFNNDPLRLANGRLDEMVRSLALFDQQTGVGVINIEALEKVTDASEEQRMTREMCGAVEGLWYDAVIHDVVNHDGALAKERFPDLVGEDGKIALDQKLLDALAISKDKVSGSDLDTDMIGQFLADKAVAAGVTELDGQDIGQRIHSITSVIQDLDSDKFSTVDGKPADFTVWQQSLIWNQVELDLQRIQASIDYNPAQPGIDQGEKPLVDTVEDPLKEKYLNHVHDGETNLDLIEKKDSCDKPVIECGEGDDVSIIVRLKSEERAYDKNPHDDEYVQFNMKDFGEKQQIPNAVFEALKNNYRWVDENCKDITNDEELKKAMLKYINDEVKCIAPKPEQDLANKGMNYTAQHERKYPYSFNDLRDVTEEDLAQIFLLTNRHNPHDAINNRAEEYIRENPAQAIFGYFLDRKPDDAGYVMMNMKDFVGLDHNKDSNIEPDFDYVVAMRYQGELVIKKIKADDFENGGDGVMSLEQQKKLFQGAAANGGLRNLEHDASGRTDRWIDTILYAIDRDTDGLRQPHQQASVKGYDDMVFIEPNSYGKLTERNGLDYMLDRTTRGANQVNVDYHYLSKRTGDAFGLEAAKQVRGHNNAIDQASGYGDGMKKPLTNDFNEKNDGNKNDTASLFDANKGDVSGAKGDVDPALLAAAASGQKFDVSSRMSG